MERKFGSLRLFGSEELAEDYLLSGERLADGSYPHLDESVAYYDENGDPFIIRKFLDEDTEEVVLVPTDVKKYFSTVYYHRDYINGNFSECQLQLKADIDRFRMEYGLQSHEYDYLFNYNYGCRFMLHNDPSAFWDAQKFVKKYGLKRAIEVYNY